MDDVGVYLVGLYTGCTSYSGKNGAVDWSIDLATGRDTYRVYLDGTKLGGLAPAADLQFGSKYTVRCRCYVGKTGRLNWTDGEVLG